MTVIEVVSRLKKSVIISEVREDEFRILTKKRYSFDWKVFKEKCSIYKLQIEGEEDTLGLIGLIDIPAEKRIEIKLLASSKENIGKSKTFEGIAGCLIAFACREATIKYGTEACVSLLPKTILINHYMSKYHMLNAGWQLYLEGNALIRLLREYYYEQ